VEETTTSAKNIFGGEALESYGSFIATGGAVMGSIGVLSNALRHFYEDSRVWAFTLMDFTPAIWPGACIIYLPMD